MSHRCVSPSAMIRSLFVALLQTAASWWRRDRIRAAPSIGRLLRLRPSSIVVVRARPAAVAARATGQTAAGPYVCYRCRTAAGDAELWVSPVADVHAPFVRWRENGVDTVLEADEVETYLPTGLSCDDAAATMDSCEAWAPAGLGDADRTD